MFIIHVVYRKRSNAAPVDSTGLHLRACSALFALARDYIIILYTFHDKHFEYIRQRREFIHPKTSEILMKALNLT
jgi:hypothetical protein